MCVWVVVGRGAMDRHDGFAFMEVCSGGFLCVCVCFACRRDGFATLSFFFLLTDPGFVIVFFLLTGLGFVIVMAVVL